MKKKFPNYFKWTYNQWSFYLIFILWGIWSLTAYDSFYIVEFIGVFTFTFINTSLLFLFAYCLCRSTCKKLGYLN